LRAFGANAGTSPLDPYPHLADRLRPGLQIISFFRAEWN
jgi:hypothetical protein